MKVGANEHVTITWHRRKIDAMLNINVRIELKERHNCHSLVIASWLSKYDI